MRTRPLVFGLIGCLHGETPPPDDVQPDPPGELVASDLQRDLAPDVDPATLGELTAGNRAFALDVFQQLRGDDNLFVSPHSISVALAMTFAGAEGNTEAEMAQALHFDMAEPGLHEVFNKSSEIVIAGERRCFRHAVSTSTWWRVSATRA